MKRTWITYVLVIAVNGCAWLASTERDPPTPAQAALARAQNNANRQFLRECWESTAIPARVMVAPNGTLILGKPECSARIGGEDVSMVATDDGQVANKAIEVGLGVALDAAMEAIQRQYPGAKLTVKVRE